MIFVCQQKFYPEDFTEQDKIHLKFHLQHYKLDVPCHQNLQNVTLTSEFCQSLRKTKMSEFILLLIA